MRVAQAVYYYFQAWNGLLEKTRREATKGAYYDVVELGFQIEPNGSGKSKKSSVPLLLSGLAAVRLFKPVPVSEQRGRMTLGKGALLFLARLSKSRGFVKIAGWVGG